MSTAEEARVLIEANEQTQKQLDGKSIKKFIFVAGRIVNIVC
jgi:leucyl-tRNA synthetase